MHSTFASHHLTGLLRGDASVVQHWPEESHSSRAFTYVVTIAVGAGLYGAAIGCWRSPLQALYTATKLPLVVFLTALGNALLNGMLAPLLGVSLGFRQSLQAVLMSFTITAAILGALAPIVLFVVWNTPANDDELRLSFLGYRFTQLVVVVGIAFAGIEGNVRLLPLLKSCASSDKAARHVLFAWLAGNLLLGSQICWLLRPFIGRPQDAVAFLGPEPFEGSFFETVLEALRAVGTGEAGTMK